MLLTEARRAARVGASGELIPLDEQDRSRWDRALIAEGSALVEEALRAGPGPYALQAAIAALHDEAPNVSDTDWPQILALYDVLNGLADNPMVKLNRVVAVAMVDGPGAGLEQLQRLEHDPRIASHYRLNAVRAHLLHLSGDVGRAVECYRVAAERTPSLPERDYLLMKAASAAG